MLKTADNILFFYDFFIEINSPQKSSLYHSAFITCLFTLVWPFLFVTTGDRRLLRHRFAFVAPGRGPLSGLCVLGSVPPALFPHAVQPTGGWLGRGEGCCGPDGGGPQARGGLPAARSPRYSPGPVHLQLCFGRAEEVAVRKLKNNRIKRILLTTNLNSKVDLHREDRSTSKPYICI